MFSYLRILLNARIARMDDRGASAIEYAALVAAFALVIIPVSIVFAHVAHDAFATQCAITSGTGTCS